MWRTKLVYNPLLFAAVALILSAALTVPASATDLTAGTGAQFKTIQQAVDAAKPGDTVLVAAGTYVENVVVNKPLTITAASGRPTVQAADASKDVFLVTSSGVHIDGLTLTGGASGVNVGQVSSCVVSNVNAYGNVHGVYLARATSSDVRNCNLSDNGYGVYCDYASSNTIANNTATGEKGAGNTLGDGIYMFYSDSNTVADNDMSASHVFGMSLYHSSNNTITGNTISQNEQFGVRLRESDRNVLTFNTLRANVQLGILIIQTTNQQIYLNNFIDQPTAMSGAAEVKLDSPQAMAYTFNGSARTGYMSNYYSDYKGSDSNGTGIGSTPSAYGDKYPLVRPTASYGTITLASAVTATPTASPSGSQNQSTTTASNQSSGATGVPGFEAAYGIVGLITALLILLGRRYAK
jgi:parallel beta-helix repeat protein